MVCGLRFFLQVFTGLCTPETDAIRAAFPHVVRHYIDQGYVTDAQLTALGVPYGRGEDEGLERFDLPQHRHRAEKLSSTALNPPAQRNTHLQFADVFC